MMVAATAPREYAPTTWTTGLAIAAVLIGMRFRSAATLAVLLTALTVALSPRATMLVAMSGLCATAYLVIRHLNPPNSPTPTRATAIATLGFSVTGAVVTAVPLQAAWLPLIAPFGLMGAFAIATHPYLRLSNQS